MAKAAKPVQTGDGGLDSGPVVIKWISIRPNKDTVQNVDDPRETIRVYFRADNTDSPPVSSYGYFVWDSAMSEGWLNLMVASLNDPTKTVECTAGTGATITFTFNNTYEVREPIMSPAPPFSINDELQSHIHTEVSKIAEST